MKSYFNLRVAAIFVDCFVVHLIYFLAIGFAGRNDTESYQFFGRNFEVTTSYYFVFWMAHFWLADILSKGITLGKWVFKIKTMHTNGQELSVSYRLLRSFLKVLSMSLVLPALYFLIVRSAYYDRIVRSKTVNTTLLTK